MEPQIARITREIPFRGIAYLIVRQCGAQTLGEQLDRELLLMSMELLAGHGHDRCWLQVSTANEAAYRLYSETGFSTRRVRSRWFRAEWNGQKDRDVEEDGK